MPAIVAVTSRDEFVALKDEWGDLLAKTDQDYPFLTHEWFDCCLAGAAGDRELLILVVREGSRLIGIAPLWRYHDTARGLWVRRIGFITSLDTPLVDFILHPEHRLPAIEAILQHLDGKTRHAWDILTLTQWPEDSPNYRLWQQLLASLRRPFFTRIASTTPYLPIQGEWSAFLGSRTPRFRKTHRHLLNRIARLGKIEVQCLQRDDGGRLFAEILSVSERSWKHPRGLTVGARNSTKTFFDALTQRAEQKGWLLAWLLQVDGVPVAAECDLQHNGVVYALRADFDEAYGKYSPGAYLNYHIIQYLFEHGYREYSFGPGLNAYKLHWTDSFRQNVDLHLCNATLKGLGLWALDRVALSLRRRLRRSKRARDAKV